MIFLRIRFVYEVWKNITNVKLLQGLQFNEDVKGSSINCIALGGVYTLWINIEELSNFLGGVGL